MSARLARAAAIGVALALASLAGTWGLLFARPLPTIDGYYRMLGLHERGEIVRDVFGIPHVYASDLHDLFFLQGYVTAQDRLVEMEQLREAASGMVLRPPSVSLDGAPPPLRGVLDAYAAGVSKLIHQVTAAGALPGELVLAGRRPADWTAEDSVAVADAFLATAGVPSRCLLAPGDLTVRGYPILAADLRLAGPAPGWYEIGLATGDGRSVGISLPGVPGLAAGHNGWIAWSMLFEVPVAPDGVSAVALMLAAQGAHAAAPLRGQEGTSSCVADVGGDVEGPPQLRVRGNDLDIDSMRVLLGPPAAAVGARLVVDLSDVHTARSVVSHGASGQPASAHFEDQAPLWEVGQLHSLQYSRPPERRVDGDLVLRAR